MDTIFCVYKFYKFLKYKLISVNNICMSVCMRNVQTGMYFNITTILRCGIIMHTRIVVTHQVEGVLVSSMNFISHALLSFVKPWLVLPNEFGPLAVGVFLKYTQMKTL